jgi:hypothetical protein
MRAWVADLHNNRRDTIRAVEDSQIMNWLGRIVIGSIFVGALFCAGMLLKAIADDEASLEQHRVAWFAACEVDHKPYECEAMWRAGENHNTIIPMPVIINH